MAQIDKSNITKSNITIQYGNTTLPIADYSFSSTTRDDFWQHYDQITITPPTFSPQLAQEWQDYFEETKRSQEKAEQDARRGFLLLAGEDEEKVDEVISAADKAKRIKKIRTEARKSSTVDADEVLWLLDQLAA